MQDFFFVGLISALALGVFLIKGTLFFIHMMNVKKSDEIITHNLAQSRMRQLQDQQIQNTNNNIESVLNWRMEDPRLTEDLRQQFLTKTKIRRTTPTSGQISPRERVPLATADFGDNSTEPSEDSVPIYTYNASIGGTQV